MADPLVSTAWLSDRLGSPDVQVIDATWYMPGEGRVGHDDYAAGHIPGAVFFDIDKVSDPATDLPHMLPSPAAFAEAAGGLGLRREATVVVYDGQGIFSAPRVWWSLRVMGFPKVFVLDGGLKAWRAEGRLLESALPAPVATVVTPAFDPGKIRHLDDIRALLDSRAAQIVDARAAPRFNGDAPEPRAGLRSGHMPGARNVPWSGLLNPDGTMKPAAELKAAFEAGGVDLAQPIVTTCGSGVSAALLALALARLGREDIPVYDGSWTEWAGRTDTPIATGA
jgi:thiosulfate/3-mercaptopyruvate sulfurtransferase